MFPQHHIFSNDCKRIEPTVSILFLLFPLIPGPLDRFLFFGGIFMNYMDDASTFERSLLQKARQKHIPVIGALELLPLCNMNCDMCYVRLSRSEMERQGRLRTVEEWVRLAEQMQKAGTVFLLLTGGEPLLFPDFKTLYRRLRNLGIILTINTNGTLLDEAWADFFATYPPRRINITLYGADAASYDRLCHFPQGFDQTLRAVRLLRARNVDVKISCSVTKKNPQDFSRIFALGKELGVPVHADHYMMPAVRERSLPFDAQVRLHPGDAAALAFQALKLQLDADIFRQYVRESVRRVNDPAFPRGDGHISCLAGNCSFFINWQSRLFPCVMLSELSAPVFDLGFLAAWETVSAKARNLSLSTKCRQCRFRPICRTCAAASFLETGSYQGAPDYLCRYAEHYYDLLLAELASFSSDPS